MSQRNLCCVYACCTNGLIGPQEVKINWQSEYLDNADVQEDCMYIYLTSGAEADDKQLTEYAANLYLLLIYLFIIFVIFHFHVD